MITAAPGHPFPSSRRALVSASKRLLAEAMGVDLHDRRVPGLLGSVVILAIIALFVAGLSWAAIDALAVRITAALL